jgi:hypothetical protein
MPTAAVPTSLPGYHETSRNTPNAVLSYEQETPQHHIEDTYHIQGSVDMNIEVAPASTLDMFFDATCAHSRRKDGMS